MSDVAEQIKEKIDIADYIGRFVKLTKTGKNFRGICPFHKESTGSFFISPDRQVWHCFGCGKGGDLLTFVTEKEGLDFRSALELLAPEAGVTIQQAQTHQPDSEKTYDAIKQAQQFFQDNLKQSKNRTPWIYLTEKRQVAPELIERFGIGFAPDSWSATGEFLLSRGFTLKELEEGGLILRKEGGGGQRGWYDRFRGRITFPIHDKLSRVVGFSARSIEAQPQGGKYINTAETPLFKKSNLLFGLHLAKESIQRLNYCIVTEGPLDVIAFHKVGMQNVVAPMGTALTEPQVRILKRISPRIVLFFDQDEAGQSATLRALHICLSQEIEVKVAISSLGKDPDETVRTNPKQLKIDLKNAVDFFTYIINSVQKKVNRKHPNFAVVAAQTALPLIKAVPNQVQQESILQRLSQELNVSVNSLTQEMAKIPADRYEVPAPTKETTTQPKPQKVSRLQALWRELNGMLLQLPRGLERDAQLVDILKDTPEPDADHPLTRLFTKMKDQVLAKGKVDHPELNTQLSEEELRLSNLLVLYNLGTIATDEEAFLSNLSQIIRDITITQIKRKITQTSLLIAQGDNSAENRQLIQDLTTQLRRLQVHLENDKNDR